MGARSTQELEEEEASNGGRGGGEDRRWKERSRARREARHKRDIVKDLWDTAGARI